MRLNYILLLQYLYDSSFWLHPLVLGYFLKQTNKRQTQTLPTCWAKLCIILFSSASVKWIVIHYLFSPLLWNVYLINPCNSLHDAFFFFKEAGLLLVSDSFDHADCTNHKMVCFLNWIDCLLVKEPREMNSKWCDLSNSQKHND